MGFIKFLSLSLAAASAANAADILTASNPRDVIPNQYIVVMKEGTSADSFSSHRAWVSDIYHSNYQKRSLQGHGIKKTFDFQKMKGYAGVFDRQTLEEIAQNPDV